MLDILALDKTIIESRNVGQVNQCALSWMPKLIVPQTNEEGSIGANDKPCTDKRTVCK